MASAEGSIFSDDINKMSESVSSYANITPPSELSEELLSDAKDVAVIGMACRVAGGNHSPEQLWESIMAQRVASSEIPAWRWEPYLSRDPRNAKMLKTTTSRGMDPQQRLTLEVTWEALENAGVDPKSLSGSDTAVFIGVNSDDYSKLLLEDLPNVDAWMGIGTAYCGVPNRVSYHLDLMGPSTAVDAACASSLVAIHHGRQAILVGESKIAIVGGVNALVGPGLTSVLDKAGAISNDGSCLSFDDNAHGYGRGEGAAIVILKHLDSAIRDGDHILALLKGSAVAQDGKTNGIMAPNAKAQELVARQALGQARLEPKTIGYVEAHATSTPLGDPTEVGAISATYGSDRTKDDPVRIGSVKPNVGHLEAGAGAVGFIKAVMAMQKGQYPPQANLKKLNSKIDWDNSGVAVVQKSVAWPQPSDHPRRAAICSYGYGGTVSHAVIEQTVSPNRAVAGTNTIPQNIVLTLSAPQEKRLAQEASNLAAWLVSPEGKEESLQSIANTLALRRARHDYRATFTVDSHDQAAAALKAFVLLLGPKINKDVVWVFSGHGAQWTDMGKELIKSSPVFCRALQPLDAITKAESGFSVLDALANGEHFDESDRVQVLTYVIQIGLAAVLKSKGLRPSAVIGHSVGEIAATVVSGALAPEEGALIVTRRAKLYARVKGQGAMYMVNLPYDQVSSELGEFGDVVAAIASSPSSCVVSGKLEEVTAYAEKAKSAGTKVMKVATDIAFHSYKSLNPLVDPLKEVLADKLKPQTPGVPLYSTSNLDPRYDGARDIEYWAQNMVKPVRLTSAVNAALDDGYRVFLEVSSHPIVSHSVNETIMDRGINDDEYSVLPTLRRNKSAETCVLQTVGSLLVKGADVDFGFQAGPGRHWSTRVPGTQWAHKSIWRKVESGVPSGSSKAATHDAETHTLLGLRNPLSGTNTVLYSTNLDNETRPFPGHHPLHGTEIVPAAVLVNTFHHATQASTLSNITLRVPVAINAPRDVQVVVADDTVKIASRLQQSSSEDHSWVTHTTGRWSSADRVTKLPSINIEAAKKRIRDVLPPNFSIDYLEKVGVSAMGFPWAITEHYGNLKEMVARVDVSPDTKEGAELPWDASSWAPILDAATSVGSTIFFNDPKLRMPAQIDQVNFYTEYGAAPPKVGYLYVEEASERGAPASHVSVCDESGNVLAEFRSMRFSEIEGTPGASGSVESLIHTLAWVPAPFASKALLWDNAVVVSDDAAILSRTARGAPVAGGQVAMLAEVPAKSEAFISELLTLTKHAVRTAAAGGTKLKVFVITSGVGAANTPTALAQAALYGLARIIASEHGEQWGGLIDKFDEDTPFPSLAMKYVQEQDVIRIVDDLPRVARLQPLPRDMMERTSSLAGWGPLGLEVASWLVEKGARRLVILSRRALPPRSEWAGLSGKNPLRSAVDRFQTLEHMGATIYSVALDIGAHNAEAELRAELSRLDLPPVLGVVHAAGTLADQLVLDTTPDAFSRVMAPKVAGALALHNVFPPGTLDWMVLFSSCGQLFGFPGQSSYASANAFLDTLAAHRRQQGDNAVAFQWTSWRGLGMAASTDFINAELRSKGITDITVEEGFRAWEHLSKYDTDHGVVLRSLAFEADEELPVPVLGDIAVRKAAPAAEAGAAATSGPAADSIPAGGPELKDWLDKKVREVISNVLMLGGADEVDGRAAIADLGVDSVLTVTLRQKLQSSLKVKVPPTLTWSHPTSNHLVAWFSEKMTKA
ncbi:hypothetical protein PG987_005919 [Apiospora arundinis]